MLKIKKKNLNKVGLSTIEHAGLFLYEGQLHMKVCEDCNTTIKSKAPEPCNIHAVCLEDGEVCCFRDTTVYEITDATIEY